MWLAHHGILGMKWGVRRYQNPDGSLTSVGRKRYGNSKKPIKIKKGSDIYRITIDPWDTTYDNKKYVSLNKEDHKKWQEYLGDAYYDMGYTTYDIKYKTTKDLKIANFAEVGKIFMEKSVSSDMLNMMINDTEKASDFLNYKSEDFDDMLHLNFAAQTQTGKMFVDELMSRGYQGIQDKHGQNTSDNPVIVFNPEKNLKVKEISYYK